MYCGVWKVGIRIYRLKASDFHRPIFWISWSEKPKAQAVVAAPIRKEWAFMLGVWMLACDKVAWSCLEKELRERGEPSCHTIRGPGVEPRRAVKFWKCETGQKRGSGEDGMTMEKGWHPVLPLKCLRVICRLQAPNVDGTRVQSWNWRTVEDCFFERQVISPMRRKAWKVMRYATEKRAALYGGRDILVERMRLWRVDSVKG